jgi:hypothetical protein
MSAICLLESFNAAFGWSYLLPLGARDALCLMQQSLTAEAKERQTYEGAEKVSGRKAALYLFYQKAPQSQLFV